MVANKSVKFKVANDLSNEKLTEAILYVADKCKGDIGITKLYKLLFLADAESFKDHGATVTNDEYVKRDFGPTPKHALAMIGLLELSGELINQKTRVSGGYEQVTPVPLRAAKRSVFSTAELAYLDWAIEKYGKKTASALSKMTHEMPAWRWAKLGDKMDLGFLSYEVRVNLSPRITAAIRDEAARHMP